jgi:hypothetical protein
VLHERRFDASGAQSGTTRFEFRSADVPDVWVEAGEPDGDAINDNSFDSSPE